MVQWRIPVHPFTLRTPHVFNLTRPGPSVLCCMQCKSFVYNPLTADWRGITSRRNMPARDPLRRFRAELPNFLPSPPSPSVQRGRIVTVPYLGRSC